MLEDSTAFFWERERASFHKVSLYQQCESESSKIVVASLAVYYIIVSEHILKETTCYRCNTDKILFDAIM